MIYSSYCLKSLMTSKLKTLTRYTEVAPGFFIKILMLTFLLLSKIALDKWNNSLTAQSHLIKPVFKALYNLMKKNQIITLYSVMLVMNSYKVLIRLLQILTITVIVSLFLVLLQTQKISLKIITSIKKTR